MARGSWLRTVANRRVGKVCMTVSARSQATAASRSRFGPFSLLHHACRDVQSREAKVDQ